MKGHTAAQASVHFLICIQLVPPLDIVLKKAAHATGPRSSLAIDMSRWPSSPVGKINQCRYYPHLRPINP